MSTLLSGIIGFLKIVIILGTLITIHELGHFVVAKLCKVKVNAFSIGFGPKLLKTKKGETEYTIRLFPFGGFVQMEGEDERSEEERAFNKKPVWQRIAIVAAGATVNIVFALIVYFCIVSASNVYVTNEVAALDEGPLYEAGIRSGDKIVSINGDKMLTLREIEEKIEDSQNDSMVFEIERDGLVEEKIVNIPYVERGNLGIAFGNSGEIIYVLPNSPAERMELAVGDIIQTVNDIECENSEDFISLIRSIKNDYIELEVLRNGENITFSGETETKMDRIYSLSCTVIQPGFFKGFKYAVDETWYFLTATIVGTAEIFTGKAENVEVMGPVGIADEITSTSTAFDFFYLMAAISLSLGIFNLLPVPALDGGRIVILLIEGIRRKPLKEKVEQGLILAGFAAILLLAIVITISDVIKIF
ncbi:MAG: RIP metalloprotease RseP [Clostridia bacterium]|nr:RIP metalloprotease RseP [Clostridia bacterium]